MIKYRVLSRCVYDGAMCHVCSKGVQGRIIFYALEDYIVFYTMFSCLLEKYGISCVAFVIMFNHYHSAVFCQDARSISSMIQVLESTFAFEYNHWHGTAGSLFKKEFSRSVKTILKKMKETVTYVNNNPVVGKICGSPFDYKWTLLAYRESSHPFSNPIPRRCEMSRGLKTALDQIDTLKKGNLYISYSSVARIFKKLSPSEKVQVVDYIISRYNFMDYGKMDSLFGSWNDAMAVFEASAGGDPDIPEDWEDYSKYLEMIEICQNAGFDMKRFCPQELEEDRVDGLFRLLSSSVTATPKQVRKFLHRQ